MSPRRSALQFDWSSIAAQVDAGRVVIHADRIRHPRPVLAAQARAAARFVADTTTAR